MSTQHQGAHCLLNNVKPEVTEQQTIDFYLYCGMLIKEYLIQYIFT